jgi:hypothetical protein
MGRICQPFFAECLGVACGTMGMELQKPGPAGQKEQWRM